MRVLAVLMGLALLQSCSPDSASTDDASDNPPSDGNVIGAPGTGIGGGLVDPDRDELDPSEESDAEKETESRKYAVFLKDTQAYSDAMEVEENEKLRISYSSFSSMKLDSEGVEPACSYNFGDNQSASQLINYEADEGPVSLQVQYVGSKVKVCFMVNEVDESSKFSYDHPAMFTSYGEGIAITNDTYPPELEVYEKIRLLFVEDESTSSYALFKETKVLFSTWLEPESDQKMRVTRESFNEIFDDVILSDCNYAFGNEAQQINYLSDFGPVSLRILYGNSGAKTILCFKVDGVDQSKDFSFQNPAMFTAFGERISATRDEHAAEMDIFKEVKLFIDKEGLLYGLIKYAEEDIEYEKVSKISKDAYDEMFIGDITPDCSSPFPGGYQEISYISEAGPVNLRVVYVDNNTNPDIDSDSRICFKVAGADESANFNFDHPSLFTAPGEKVNFKLSQYEAELDFFRRAEIIEEE